MEEMNDRISRCKTHYYTAFDFLGIREIRMTEANMSFFERFPRITKKGESLTGESSDLSQRHSKLLNRSSYTSYMSKMDASSGMYDESTAAGEILIESP